MNGGIKVKKSRKFIISCIIIGLFMLAWGYIESWVQGYQLQAVCISCNPQLVCTFEDENGKIWEITDCYFLVCEPVTLYMHDNYTPSNIHDDIVMDVVSNNQD